MCFDQALVELFWVKGEVVCLSGFLLGGAGAEGGAWARLQVIQYYWCRRDRGPGSWFPPAGYPCCPLQNRQARAHHRPLSWTHHPRHRAAVLELRWLVWRAGAVQVSVCPGELPGLAVQPLGEPKTNTVYTFVTALWSAISFL